MHRMLDGMTADGYEVDTSRTKETGKVYVNGEAWNIDDLITEQDKLDAFDEDMMRTKADIIGNIKALLREIDIAKRGDSRHSQVYYSHYQGLLKQFMKIVTKCVFPERLEDWWYYSYEVEETGITLRLKHVQHFNLNNEGFFDSFSIDTSFDLIKVSSKMMTVDQYAAVYEVTPTTVRQWIRRGKIRTAVKMGSEWRIPELAEVRERGYKMAYYHWDDVLTDIPKEFEFLNDYSGVTIEQDSGNKELFNACFSGGEKRKKITEKNIQMNKKERERMELILISNPYVKPSSALIALRE